MVVNPKSMDPRFLAFMEDEAKRTPKQGMDSEDGTLLFRFAGKR